MMKRTILSIAVCCMSFSLINAQQLPDPVTGTFTDPRDGKTYTTVKIGDQVWMAENLAYLPSVSGPSTGSQTEPFMYVYGYDGTDVNAAKATANFSTYGVLYNWPAAMTVCPEGWHLPSDAEWTTLTEYLISNGYGYEGSGTDIAKSMAANINWTLSSTPGTPGNDPASNNSSGFSGLPGGNRINDGSFWENGDYGIWWSSMETFTDYAGYRALGYGDAIVFRYDYIKEVGLSVRCLKDETNVADTLSMLLIPGWNLVSTNVVPENPDMQEIFDSVIQDSLLIAIQDEAGNIMEQIPGGEGWQNDIGNIQGTEGYKVRVTDSTTVSLSGTRISLPYKIPLNPGWNYIGYPHTAILDGKLVVQQLIDRNVLEKVQDEKGNAIENLGAFGGWQNDIGSFAPGEGYRIKVTDSDTLTLTGDMIMSNLMSSVDTLFPDFLITEIQQDLQVHETDPDYDGYVLELNNAVQTLHDTVSRYFSPGELEQGIIDFKANFQNPVLKSTAGIGCDIVNLGLGYAKGISVKDGVSAGVGYYVYTKLSAQQGGTAEIVYDFVNLTRQVYTKKYCSVSGLLGLGFGASLKTNYGVSGFVKWIFNIPHYQENAMNRFEGASRSSKIGLSPNIHLGLGLQLNGSIGYARGVEGDCASFYNVSDCPVYYGMTPKVDGTTSCTFDVGVAGSTGLGTDVYVGLSYESTGICTSGIPESYHDFTSNTKSRLKAACNMAAELLTSAGLYPGVIAVGSPIDLIAASSALVYGSIGNPSDCNLVTLPTVSTDETVEIGLNGATVSGTVLSEGGENLTERGICWNTEGFPSFDDNKVSAGSGLGSFTSSLQGLSPNTTYYARAYAVNNEGVGYGYQVSFKTLPSGECVDADGRSYRTVQIGSQVWMAENLAYLPAVSGPSVVSETEPFMYVYGYDGTDVEAAKATTNYSTYGVLYNWPAALTACPAGWHLPSDAEWTTLTDYLINNGYGFEGSGTDIAKSMAATTNWNLYSTAGTPGNDPASNNSSGFSGLPGGYRNVNGIFSSIGYFGYWWSSTESSTDYAWLRRLGYSNSYVNRLSYGREDGFSVRCLRDY